MLTLLIGLLLFAAIHLWRRLAPASRARAGDAGKGVVAVGSALGIWLLARGYGGWENPPAFWGRTGALTHVNNLLVVVAFYLFVASGARTGVTRLVRHPQLVAVMLWATAHLLVNGDAASLVLFGGLLLWAGAEIVLIDRSPRPEVAHAPGAALVPATAWGREAAALAITAAAVAGAVWLHGRIGPWPLG